MNIIVRLYETLTSISYWIESLRISLLVRIWGIDSNEKPPKPWREREKIPPHGQWPEAKTSVDSRLSHPALLVGAVRVGPVKPVPAQLDKEQS